MTLLQIVHLGTGRSLVCEDVDEDRACAVNEGDLLKLGCCGGREYVWL